MSAIDFTAQMYRGSKIVEDNKWKQQILCSFDGFIHRYNSIACIYAFHDLILL